jgi:hypothetical protein
MLTSMLLTPLPPPPLVSGIGSAWGGLESLRLSLRECEPDLRFDDPDDELGGVELPPLPLLTPAGRFPFCSSMRWHSAPPSDRTVTRKDSRNRFGQHICIYQPRITSHSGKGLQSAQQRGGEDETTGDRSQIDSTLRLDHRRKAQGGSVNHPFIPLRHPSIHLLLTAMYQKRERDSRCLLSASIRANGFWHPSHVNGR